MAEGKHAQPRPDGGGGHHPMAKHRPGGPAAQQLHVVDAVATGDQGVDEGEQLAAGTGLARPALATARWSSKAISTWSSTACEDGIEKVSPTRGS
jgi:hypothetical protein